MPNIKSAIKRVAIIKQKTVENSMVKSALKTQLKKYDDALKSGNSEQLTENYNKAVKSIDKAAAKGVIHKNTANRKKSAIAKKLNQSK